MAKRTITALLSIAMLAFFISCTQAQPENQSPNNPSPPDNPNPPTQSSSVVESSSSSKASNGSVECNGYCKWDTGCVRISTDPTGEYGSVISTCEAAITNCTRYSPSKQTYANDACSGGTVTPSSSSSKPVTVSSSSSNATGGSTQCDGYCKWDTGCVRISTDPTGVYGSIISSCIDAISNCQAYSPSKQVYSTEACK